MGPGFKFVNAATLIIPEKMSSKAQQTGEKQAGLKEFEKLMSVDCA